MVKTTVNKKTKIIKSPITKLEMEHEFAYCEEMLKNGAYLCGFDRKYAEGWRDALKFVLNK